MSAEQMANGIVGLAGLYVGVGLLLAVQLQLRGLKQIDAGVAGTGIVFRLLITPGLVAFWPLLLKRWLAARAGEPVPPPYERPLRASSLRTIHLLATRALAVIAPVVVVAALWAREPAHTVGAAATKPPLETAGSPVLLTGELPITLTADVPGHTLYCRVHSPFERPGLTVYWQAATGGEPVALGPITNTATATGARVQSLPLPPEATEGDTIMVGSAVTGETYLRGALP